MTSALSRAAQRRGKLRRTIWIPAGVGGALVAALVIGIPTAVIANPWFTRMTPVRTLDVVFWAVTALLLGALAATYVRPERPAPAAGAGRSAAGSGVLGVLAVGCPVCNKIVVALIGTSGALSTFAPLQPILGGAGVALAAGALYARVRANRSCALPAPAQGPVAGV